MRRYYDNKFAINITHNLVQHDQTKHKEIDRHLIKEKLDSGLIYTPLYIYWPPTCRYTHKRFKQYKVSSKPIQVGNEKIYPPTWGGSVEEWNKESCDSKERIRQSRDQKDFIVIELGKSWIWVLGFLYIYIYMYESMYKKLIKKKNFLPFILQFLFYNSLQSIQRTAIWMKEVSILTIFISIQQFKEWRNTA